jgi:hypothetical protein
MKRKCFAIVLLLYSKLYMNENRQSKIQNPLGF